MKKLLTVFLVFGMLLALGSYAFAGTITWGGNLRFWYMDVQNPSDSLSTFLFDRVELTVKDVIDEHQGFNATVQWRNFSSNDSVTTDVKSEGTPDEDSDDGTVTSDSTKITNSGTKQARLDSGYYYYKGLLGKDEIDIGALSNLPFRNSFSKNVNFVDGGLGSRMKVAYTVGMAYTMSDPRYTAAFGFGNSNEKDISNSVGVQEGFAYSARLDTGKDFFGLVPGLCIGVGYNSWPQGTDSDNDCITGRIVDLVYNTSLGWVDVECGSQTTTDAGNDTDAAAYYFETGVNIGKNKVWFGRLINDSDSDYYIYQYKDTLSPTNIINKNFANGDILAAIIPILGSSDLQFQYIRGDGGDYKEFDVRYRFTL